MKALVSCSKCGLVYFVNPSLQGLPSACCANVLEQIYITATVDEYSEAGGTITGIDVTVNVE